MTLATHDKEVKSICPYCGVGCGFILRAQNGRLVLLTTGRTFMQYNAGTMTRRTRSGRAEPENFVQLNARDAEKLGIEDGGQVRVRTRGGELVVKAEVSEVAQDVAWMPFHYVEAQTNLLTNDALDPVCRITELKVCAARAEPMQ